MLILYSAFCIFGASKKERGRERGREGREEEEGGGGRREGGRREGGEGRGRIRSFIHQVIQLFEVLLLHLELADPSILVWALVDDDWVLDECFVALHHLSAYWGIDICADVKEQAGRGAGG